MGASDLETGQRKLRLPRCGQPLPLCADLQAIALMRITFPKVSCCPVNFLNAGTFSHASLLVSRRVTEVL